MASAASSCSARACSLTEKKRAALSLLLGWREAYLPALWRERLLQFIGDDLRPLPSMDAVLLRPDVQAFWAAEAGARDFVARNSPLPWAEMGERERALLIRSFDLSGKVRDEGELRRLREGIVRHAWSRSGRSQTITAGAITSSMPSVHSPVTPAAAAFVAAMPSVQTPVTPAELDSVSAALPMAPGGVPRTQATRDQAVFWFSSLGAGPRDVLYGDLWRDFGRRPRDEDVLRRIEEAWWAQRQRQQKRQGIFRRWFG